MSSNVIENNTNIEHTPLEYVYVTIPAEYVCVYHRILAMLADYGIDMLKDCKASCTERNSGVIECFNMFNAAVAARKLGGEKNEKLAETLIKYIKAKINQIYKSKDNSTGFVFPVDENGEIKAFVSCKERPFFFINPDDGELYEHKLHNGSPEHFRLGEEDDVENSSPVEGNYAYDTAIPSNRVFDVIMVPRFEKVGNIVKPCVDIIATYQGYKIATEALDSEVYINDNVELDSFDSILEDGKLYKFSCIVRYNNNTVVKESWLRYEITR